MTIVGLVLLCLLGLYIFFGGMCIWGCLSDDEITPISYFHQNDYEELHTMTYGWAPHLEECISEWWIDVSIWMSNTLSILGVIIIFPFLLLAFIAFLIEWTVVMILQIPFVIICIIFELLDKLGRLLFCKK